ncbi:MAG TPA: hypothetical protein ENO11_00490 [Desulfobacteraceae bacterium]|nr:hypothetical protein [Desulfobacteraceae bacterium]
MTADKHSGNELSFHLPSLPPLWYLVAGMVFLGISYAPYHHWDEYFYLYSAGTFSLPELLDLEPGLALGLFPPAFFSSKIGFVAFLDLLCGITGDGLDALTAIQFVFALVVLAFTGASWLLLRELFGRDRAQYITFVLLFMPLSLYFSYKVFSELFSLVFIAVGCVAYLRTLRASSGAAVAGYGSAALVLLMAGVLCRFTSIAFFGGLVLGLFVLGDPRFPFRRNFLSAAVMTILVVALSGLFYIVVVGLEPAEFAGLFGAVQDKSPSLVMKVYAVFMSVQLFFVPLFFVLWKLGSATVRFAVVWALVCILPFILIAKYVEPRYFYMAALPLAILAHYGLLRLVSFLLPRRKAVAGWLVLLAVVVVGNRFSFFSLMIYEHDQHQYSRMHRELKNRFPEAVYLVPWVSDYSFLRFAFPEEKIKLAWSPEGYETLDFFRSQSYLRWAGGREMYIDSPERLASLGGEALYVGWRYNPPAVRLKKKMLWLQNKYVKDVEVSEGLKNHLAQSWLWESPLVELKPVLTVEPYEAFSVETVVVDSRK